MHRDTHISEGQAAADYTFSSTTVLIERTYTGKWINIHLKPNSWTYNFVEVSGHNLRVLRLEVSGHNRESFQTWGYCMDFLNHKEGGRFPPFSFTVYINWTLEAVRGCVSLKKYKSQGKAVEVTMNSKEENSSDWIRPRIRPQDWLCHVHSVSRDEGKPQRLASINNTRYLHRQTSSLSLDLEHGELLLVILAVSFLLVGSFCLSIEGELSLVDQPLFLRSSHWFIQHQNLTWTKNESLVYPILACSKVSSDWLSRGGSHKEVHRFKYKQR